jgi:hypothetical protein
LFQGIASLVVGLDLRGSLYLRRGLLRLGGMIAGLVLSRACELRLVQEAAMKLEDEFLQKDVLKAVVDKLKEKENEVQLGEVCRTASVDKEGLLGVTVGSDLEKLFS